MMLEIGVARPDTAAGKEGALTSRWVRRQGFEPRTR
jgi:hypothetical protein